jgi:hypothetical protein
VLLSYVKKTVMTILGMTGPVMSSVVVLLFPYSKKMAKSVSKVELLARFGSIQMQIAVG